MIKRALVSGLPGTGVNVWDLGTVAIPVARYFVRNNESISSGIHVRISPFDQRVIDIRFMDAQGMNQSSTAEREIERPRVGRARPEHPAGSISPRNAA